MKELALGAAMLASVVFSKTEVVFAPDRHIDLAAAGACDFAASDPEFFSEEFDRLLCEAAQAIPYDSLNCFFGSFMLRMIDHGEPEKIITEKRETIDEQQETSLLDDCGAEPCSSDEPWRFTYGVSETGQTD